METIIKNLQTIHQRIEKACQKKGRSTDDVKLLLATKTVSVDRIKIAIEAGETLLGENKAQEVKQKIGLVKNGAVKHHFIGHLQTNKIKEVLRYSDCIQSLDRLSLAEKLQKRLAFEDKHIDVLIQVNTSFEQSKFGLAPSEVIPFIKEVASYPNIHIKGLMTIGLFSAELSKVRKCFRLLREISEQVTAQHIKAVRMDDLSMGMSNDLEVAIEEGATIVRVGTAIFGERIYPDTYYWNEDITEA